MEFSLPGAVPGKLEYVPKGVDEQNTPCGSIYIYWGPDYENKTEVDSLQYAIDAIEGLVREYESKQEKSQDNTSEQAYYDHIDSAMMDHYDMMNGDIGDIDFESIEDYSNTEPKEAEEEDFSKADADDIAGDLVRYLYDVEPKASYIGDIYARDGRIALKYDFKGADTNKIYELVQKRYGDRVKPAHGHTQYAPEIKFSALVIYPPASAEPITESTDDVKPEYVIIDNFPVWAVEPMANDSWGDYLTYCGEKIAKEDFTDIDNFMTSNGYCDIIQPTDEEYQSSYNESCAHPAFGKPTSTCLVHAVKGKWNSLMEKFDLNRNDNDVESSAEKIEEPNVEPAYRSFQESITKLCTIAGKPALAEDVNKAYNQFHYESKKQIKYRTAMTPSGKLEIEDTHRINNFICEVYSADGWDSDLVENLVEEIKNQCKPGDVDVDHWSPIDNLNDDRGGVTFQIILDFHIPTSMLTAESRVVGAMCKFKKTENNEIVSIYESVSGPATHRIPEDVARMAHNHVADECHWSDELRKSEFEGNWEWLEENYDCFWPVWEQTHDIGKALQAIYNDEEDRVFRAEASMCM